MSHSGKEGMGRGFAFMGGGEMGRLTREFDWKTTPVGAPSAWSAALHTTLPIILSSRFPHLLWWGPDFVQFYNDAYIPIAGAKHPDRSFGKPGREGWSEIWDVLRPLVERPFRGGEPTWNDDILLQINRHGFTEETHFTIAYSPVPDESAPGGIGGVLATVHEITDRVVSERRVAVVRDLSARVSDARTAQEACAYAAATLAPHDKDIPFALIYLVSEDRTTAKLAGATGAGLSPDFSSSPCP